MNEVLTSASAQNSAPNYATWTSYEDDIFAFYNLLMVFYGKPFGADNWTKVSKITELAERFKALPCLSSLLPMIYSTSPSLLESIDVNAHMILPIAAKLRNAVLFKECLIFVITPGVRKDRELWALRIKVFERLLEKYSMRSTSRLGRLFVLRSITPVPTTTRLWEWMLRKPGQHLWRKFHSHAFSDSGIGAKHMRMSLQSY